MKRLIYADNAATTRLDPAVLEAMLPWLRDEYGNPSQPYSLARGPRKALKQARDAIAACIEAEPDEIFFTSGGTESDNWAIKGILRPQERDMLITSTIEHPAVWQTALAMRETGHPVSFLPVDKNCLVGTEDLEIAMKGAPRLASVMLVNNETGAVQPVRNLARIAHEGGALFHTDAVQAIGHIPVSVRHLGVDMLSASAHKFHGPRGAGFLYARKGTPLFAYAHGGSQERGLRAGTENTAAIVGMATALNKCCQRMEQNGHHLRMLESSLLGALSSAGVDFRRNAHTSAFPGIISLSFRGAEGETLLHRLDLKGICISTGSACSSGQKTTSRVVRAMGVPKEYARGTVRISLGAENTQEDALAIAAAIVSVVSQRLA